MQLVKGITWNRFSEKWYAQYWNKDLKSNHSIGYFNTKEEAIEARANYIMGIYDGTIIQEPNGKPKLPKGIRQTKSNKYLAMLEFKKTGRIKNNHIQYSIGVFDTIEEAVEKRKEFILNLL